jgi:hypothetical protein
MSGAILPLPQFAFMVWCSVKAQGHLYLYLFTLYRTEFPLIFVGRKISVANGKESIYKICTEGVTDFWRRYNRRIERKK